VKEQRVCADIDCLSMTRPDIIKRAGGIAWVELTRRADLSEFHPKKVMGGDGTVCLDSRLQTLQRVERGQPGRGLRRPDIQLLPIVHPGPAADGKVMQIDPPYTPLYKGSRKPPPGAAKFRRDHYIHTHNLHRGDVPKVCGEQKVARKAFAMWVNYRFVVTAKGKESDQRIVQGAVELWGENTPLDCEGKFVCHILKPFKPARIYHHVHLQRNASRGRAEMLCNPRLGSEAGDAYARSTDSPPRLDEECGHWTRHFLFVVAVQAIRAVQSRLPVPSLRYERGIFEVV
jgi:hypothetical protein